MTIDFKDHYDYIVDKEKEAKIGESPNGWIQWKGTNVCVDLYCSCGKHFHLDADFAYYTECPECGTLYALGQNIALIPLDGEQREFVRKDRPGLIKEAEDDE